MRENVAGLSEKKVGTGISFVVKMKGYYGRKFQEEFIKMLTLTKFN